MVSPAFHLASSDARKADDTADVVGLRKTLERLHAQREVPAQCFSAWTHDDVEAVLRKVDTNNDPIRADPSLPKRASRFAAPATVRVQWIDGRGPTLSHDLQ
jgi:hypothetical protein